jgi:hypothetical protein
MRDDELIRWPDDLMALPRDGDQRVPQRSSLTMLAEIVERSAIDTNGPAWPPERRVVARRP